MADNFSQKSSIIIIRNKRNHFQLHWYWTSWEGKHNNSRSPSRGHHDIELSCRFQLHFHVPLTVLMANLKISTVKHPNHKNSLFQPLYMLQWKTYGKYYWKFVRQEGVVVGVLDSRECLLQKLMLSGALIWRGHLIEEILYATIFG